MGFSAPTTGGDGTWEIPPEGNLRAVVVGLIDLGHHYEEFVAKKEGEKDSKGYKHKVYLVMETRKKNKKGEPFYVGQMYTLSLVDRATLRKVYAALVGAVPKDANADVRPLLGKPCQVQVEHTKGEKKYPKVTAVSGPTEDDAENPPKPAVAPLLWSVDDGGPFPEPAWMPRIYGQTVADFIGLSRERGGNASHQRGEQGNGGQPQYRQPAMASAAASAEDAPFGFMPWLAPWMAFAATTAGLMA